MTATPSRTPLTSAPLSVCLATWDDDPPLGGQGVYMRELRTGLERRGVAVHTVAGRGPYALAYPRITGRGHLDMTLALLHRPQTLLDGQPDVVHVSGGPGGLNLLRRLPVPVVYTAHHTYRQAHGRASIRRWYGALEARSYRRAAMVATPSPSTADHVLRAGVPTSKVVVISPGIRADAGVDDSMRLPGRMLFVGRLEPEKGPLDAVWAMDKVAARVPGAHGVVVGQGSLSADVARACRATGGTVSYVGHVDDDELRRQRLRAQVVLVPSAYEGLGLVALEAMGVGAAVVGYDVCGLRDAIGADGVLVAPGDRAALARSCADLLTDDDGRRRLAADAQTRVRRERSWVRFAAQFDELYRAVASGA